MYLWGSFAIGADPDAGWQWRWYDAKTHGVHASAIAKPPDDVTAQHQMQGGMMSRASWAVVASNDPRRAVGFQSDGARSLVFSLVEGEAPSAIELEDGSAFGLLEAGIAAPGDRTILAGAVGDPAGTAVYLARGARAERIARIPRIGVLGRPSPALVALHTDGVRIAIAVEDHDVASRTDAAFYVREAYPSDGPMRRFGTTRTLRACNTDSQGFEAWSKLELASDLSLPGARTAHLSSPTRARLRFGDDGSVCIAEATSDVDGEAAAALATMPLHAAAPGLGAAHGGARRSALRSRLWRSRRSVGGGPQTKSARAKGPGGQPLFAQAHSYIHVSCQAIRCRIAATFDATLRQMRALLQGLRLQW